MHLAVRARRLIARHPSVYWLLCAVLALGTAATVYRQVVALDDARHSWGDTTAVLVATADHEPGAPLRATRVALPVAMVPASAVRSPPAGATTRQRIAEGEVIVASDLTSAVGPAARAREGTAVVGVTDPLARHVVIGIGVAVAADGVVIAAGARVVDLADDVIFVSVDTRDAPAVAAAARQGLASIIFEP